MTNNLYLYFLVSYQLKTIYLKIWFLTIVLITNSIIHITKCYSIFRSKHFDYFDQ